MNDYDLIRPEFCTYHDSKAAVVCAYVWHDNSIKAKNIERNIFIKFEFE